MPVLVTVEACLTSPKPCVPIRIVWNRIVFVVTAPTPCCCRWTLSCPSSLWRPSAIGLWSQCGLVVSRWQRYTLGLVGPAWRVDPWCWDLNNKCMHVNEKIEQNSITIIVIYRYYYRCFGKNQLWFWTFCFCVFFSTTSSTSSVPKENWRRMLNSF